MFLMMTFISNNDLIDSRAREYCSTFRVRSCSVSKLKGAVCISAVARRVISITMSLQIYKWYTNRGKHGLKHYINITTSRIVKNIGDRLTLIQKLTM